MLGEVSEHVLIYMHIYIYNYHYCHFFLFLSCLSKSFFFQPMNSSEYEYYSTILPTKKKNKKKSINDLECVNTLHFGQVAQHNSVVIPSGCFTCMNEFSFTTHEMLNKKY